jgi:hypothetical protein
LNKITKKGNFNGTHITKNRKFLIAYTSNLKTHFGISLPKKETFDRTHIIKKGYFDGLYKQFKIHFGIKLPKKEFLMGPTLQNVENQLNKPHYPFINRFANLT